MSDVRPQTKQQAVLTTALSWFVLAYIAGLGCVCLCANASDASVDESGDIALSAHASVDGTQHVDARLLPALETVERIASMAHAERAEEHPGNEAVKPTPSPIPNLRYAPKTSPPIAS